MAENKSFQRPPLPPQRSQIRQTLSETPGEAEFYPLLDLPDLKGKITFWAVFSKEKNIFLKIFIYRPSKHRLAEKFLKSPKMGPLKKGLKSA